MKTIPAADEESHKKFRKEFVLLVITLTVSCCIVILVFSLLLINRIQNNNSYIFGDIMILLVILTACIFITRYITSYLMKEDHKEEEVLNAAEMSNREKGIFLSQVSHEIRTPMNVIIGISEIQLLDKSLPAKAQEGYRKIYESGSLLLNIINDILDFSKVGTDKPELICEEYDVPGLINDTVQLTRLRFKTKPITLKVILDEDTPCKLLGDKLRIKQIINNLLSNAFKNTEAGDVIFSICAETNNNNENVTFVFRIKDSGHGITESRLSSLFDEYTCINGTGLGMSITKRLINMMSGEINVKSNPDEGSVYTVRLPQIRCGTSLCGENNTSPQKISHNINHQMPYGKVLIVDDVETNLFVAKGLLSPYGLHIETVNSGFDAIEKIKNNQTYDIIFMDHMMPDMDGIKTTKLLREMGYTHPIVALTANAVIGQKEMFLSNGFDGFISKPIDSRELNHILVEFIQMNNCKNI